MKDCMSINEIALTCIGLINCVEFYVVDGRNLSQEFRKESDESKSPPLDIFNGTQTEEILLTRTSTWNYHLRSKPKEKGQVFGIVDYKNLKHKTDRDYNYHYRLFTGAKKYTGGLKGSGHSWLLSGVKSMKKLETIYQRK